VGSDPRPATMILKEVTIAMYIVQGIGHCAWYKPVNGLFVISFTQSGYLLSFPNFSLIYFMKFYFKIGLEFYGP